MGQQFLISSGESSLPYSQTTMLSGKLISFLGPREQHWVFHHLDHSLAYRWTPDPNRANQAQSWDLKPGSLAYWLGHDPDNDYSPVLSNLCHSVSSLPEGFVRSYTFILHSFCLFLSQTFGQDLMPVFLGFFNAEFCDFQMQSPGHQTILRPPVSLIPSLQRSCPKPLYSPLSHNTVAFGLRAER